MKAKITEIFGSLQGEGKYIGVPQVFVRFAHCNLDCAYCDTPHLIDLEEGNALELEESEDKSFVEMSVEAVFSTIEGLAKDVHSISFTGGEPLLQGAFLMELFPLIRQAGHKIFLETNGVMWQSMIQVCDWIDIVAMDVKLPSSTGLKPFWKEHEAFIDVALEKDLFIKAVITRQTRVEDIDGLIQLIEAANPHLLVVLQPATQDLEKGVMPLCRAYQARCLKRLSNVRIIPQVHRMLKIR